MQLTEPLQEIVTYPPPQTQSLETSQSVRWIGWGVSEGEAESPARNVLSSGAGAAWAFGNVPAFAAISESTKSRAVSNTTLRMGFLLVVGGGTSSCSRGTVPGGVILYYFILTMTNS
jgi:hypothetical protein